MQVHLLQIILLSWSLLIIDDSLFHLPSHIIHTHTRRNAGAITFYGQFISGEDLLDPTRIKFLSSPSFYAMNVNGFLRKWSGSSGERGVGLALERLERRCQTPSSCAQPPQAGYHLGETSTSFAEEVEKCLRTSGEYFSGRAGVELTRWCELMLRKYQSALQEPGESVGLLAAQVRTFFQTVLERCMPALPRVPPPTPTPSTTKVLMRIGFHCCSRLASRPHR